jgi:hypothetical protein
MRPPGVTTFVTHIHPEGMDMNYLELPPTRVELVTNR